MDIYNRKCNKCGEIKPIYQFHVKGDDFKKICISCINSYRQKAMTEKIKSINCKAKRLTAFQRKTISCISKHFGLKTNHAFIMRRIQPLPMIRFFSFYFLQEQMTQEQIAKLFGLKDHSSVALGLIELENNKKYDKEFRKEFEIIKNKLA